MKIGFNRPCFQGKELSYIAEAIQAAHISGDGAFTKKCQNYLEQIFITPKVLLTTSCTDALELSAILLNLSEGDEVILPSFTFVSTANAFLLRGAKPVFVDIRPDTLNLDETKLESKITKKTKAIVVVHYAGVGCEMDEILFIASKHNIPVIEDNAHGLFGKYRGKYLGSFGALATQSFHETKNVTCGEGGAIIINDKSLVERAEIVREKGTNRSLFFRGQVDKYSWMDIGSSYLPSDILAAFLLAQLEAHQKIQDYRKLVWNHYYAHIKQWALSSDTRLPAAPDYCDQAFHMFYIVLPTLETRTALTNHLKIREIQAVFHYLPLHLSPMGSKLGYKEGDFPVTEHISNRLLRLPFYNEIDLEQVAYICDIISKFNI